MSRPIPTLVLCGALMLAPRPAAPTGHPLDPLTAAEIEAAVALADARAGDDEPRRYPLVRLREPPKEKVLAWTPGQAVPRAALERRGRRRRQDVQGA